MAELAGFNLTEHPETHKLIARFEPAEGRMPPDSAFVRQAIEDLTLSDCFIDEHAITSFVSKSRTASQPSETAQAPVEIEIGERRDGWVEVSLSENKMTAWLSIGRAMGGRPVAVADVHNAISAKGISHGLKEDVLTQCILAGQCNMTVIAEGTEATPGIRARFESLLDDIKSRRSDHENEWGTIDYRDLGELLLVEPGAPLIKRVPAVQGSDGMNVCGRVVPVKPVPDEGFAKGMSGVTVSSDDANLLVAEIAGQPKVMENGATVNPVIELTDVDLSTGNIEFEGTINVGGDIKTGMSVRVAGDLIVQGTVESAVIVAGGDVSVKGGIVGRADSGSGSQETARITAKGSVSSRFIEHAYIEAGGDILVEAAARQSELYAGNEIVIGKPGSSQGQLIGGHARALLHVKAVVAGAVSGAPTVIQVGYDPRLNAERISIEQNKKQRLAEYARVKQVLAFIKQHPAKGEGGVLEKAERTCQQIENDLAEMDRRFAEISEKLELVDGAWIEIAKTIYGGVNLQIGGKLAQIMDQRSGGKVRLVDGVILIS